MRAADAGAWQAGVQQSFLDLSTGLAGILPSIEQPAIPLGEAADALAAAGASARPSAQSIEISSRITCARIGGKGYLSMNGHLVELERRFMIAFIWLISSVWERTICAQRFLISASRICALEHISTAPEW